MVQKDYEILLKEYRTIWNNRLLAVGCQGSEEVLKEAIKRELLDENSHPRIRRNKYEKYYMALTRILTSPLSSEHKLELISIHNGMMEQI